MSYTHPGYFRRGVRESMGKLPFWLQPILTRITGKPLRDETLRRGTPPVFGALWSAAAALAAVVLPLIAFRVNTFVGLATLPVSWVVLTGRLRSLQVVYGHHACHKTLVKSKAMNLRLLEFMTLFVISQNGSEYTDDHIKHHSKAIFTTIEDADAAFLWRFGFRPGRTKGQLWLTLAQASVSPYFHGFFLLQRVKSNVLGRSGALRVLALCWIGIVAGIGPVLIVPFWQWCLVTLIPYVILFHVSALLQFLTEHAWLLAGETTTDNRAYAARCWGRFTGDAIPLTRSPLAWTIWAFRIACWHWPIRSCVLVGDLPAHDWHHLSGYLGMKADLWPEAIYARQRSIDNGDKLDMASRELWGLGDMLHHVFETLSSAPALDLPNHPPSQLDFGQSGEPVGAG